MSAEHVPAVLQPHLNPRIAAQLVPLGAEERAELEASILAEGFRDPIVVWAETGDLLDGRTRMEIRAKHGLPMPPLVERSFRDEGEAIAWVLRNQLARRNLTPVGASLLRGKLLEQRKRNDRANLLRGKQAVPGAQVEHPGAQAQKTRAQVAAQTGVSPATVGRDAVFARAVGKIEQQAGPEAVRAIVGGDLGLRQRQVAEFAQGEDLSIDALRAFAKQCDAKKKARAARDADPAAARPFFQRAARPETLETYTDPQDGREYADRVQLSCGHWHVYKRRRPVPRAAKAFPCVECGSGTRRAHERWRVTQHLDRRVRDAVLSDVHRPELVAFIQASLLLVSFAPHDARAESVREDVMRSAQKLGLLDRPRAAAHARTSEEE